MSAVSSYFTDFLDNIRLTPELRDACERVHTELRAKLQADPSLREIIVGQFLQGSYRRHTGVKPSGQDLHVDVDLVVVTTLHPDQYTPAAVLARFQPFLDAHYPGQWEANDRSMKISPRGTEVTIDLVVTSAPSEMQQEFIRKSLAEAGRIEARGDRAPLVLTEAFKSLQKAGRLEAWQQEPLLIPSRDLRTWVPTHPLEQIRWTIEKGTRTNGHYVNVVKTIKWWRKSNPDGNYPKGYPLEHLIGTTCADGIDSVAAGVVSSLESIRDAYRGYPASGLVPVLADHGVPDNNVFKRITAQQFAIFWRLIERAATDARSALETETAPESAEHWRTLLGPEFPEPPKGTGFVPPSGRAQPTSGGRFG